MLSFIASYLSFEYHGIYYTNTTSNQITGNYWPHKTILYVNKSIVPCEKFHMVHTVMVKEKTPPRLTSHIALAAHDLQTETNNQ